MMVTMPTVNLEDALFEEDLSFMEEMLAAAAEAGNVRPEMDEFLIRKIIIKQKILTRKMEEQKAMRDRIVAEWNNRIDKKAKEIEQLRNLVEYYIVEKNKGQKLELDVATVSMRKVNDDLVVKDDQLFKQYFEQQGDLCNYLKPAEFDKTKAKKALLEGFETMVQQQADLLIAAEAEQTGKKVTKKRQEQIFSELKNGMLAVFKATLPEGVEYKEESKTLSIKMNS
jgi:hypothetical protein